MALEEIPISMQIMAVIPYIGKMLKYANLHL